MRVKIIFQNIYVILGAFTKLRKATISIVIPVLSRMEKISWTDHVRNEEVLLRVND